jgi:hypothetical protein
MPQFYQTDTRESVPVSRPLLETIARIEMRKEVNEMTPRETRAITTDGVLTVMPLSDHEASLIGQHHNAVKAFLNEGDVEALLPFAGVKVGGRLLETDPDEIESLARDGDFGYDDIYDY